MMKTHQLFNIRSHLHSWWPTRQPWIILIVAVLLLQPIVDGKWDSTYTKSCKLTYNELRESTMGNVILFHNSSKPLEMTCNLNPYDENVKMLFKGQDELKQSPSSRIVFMNLFNDTFLDTKYVSVINNTAAKLVIPNPPIGDTFIACMMLSDAYFTTNVTDKYNRPYMYGVCCNEIRVIELEDVKINIIGVTDTTVDIKLDWPLAFALFDKGTIYIDYSTSEEQAQTSGQNSSINNTYTVKNDTVISLENLKSSKVYFISMKYCLGEDKNELCSKFTTPIKIKTAKRPVDKMDVKTTTMIIEDEVVKTPITSPPAFSLMDIADYLVLI